MRKRLVSASVVLLVVSVFGFGGSLLLNSIVFDKYAAYGEVPIPGTRTLHLPAGDVKVSFHTEILGTIEGGGLPVPQKLAVTITPPGGSAGPTFVQNIGGTDADNQDARVQVGVAHIPAAGDYTIKADGKASAFLSPRLSFGHGSDYGFLPWLFAGLGGLSLLALLVSALSSVKGGLEESAYQHVSETGYDQQAAAGAQARKLRIAVALVGLTSLGVVAAAIVGVGIPFLVVISAIVLLCVSALLFALRYWVRHTHTREDPAATQAAFRANQHQIEGRP